MDNHQPMLDTRPGAKGAGDPDACMQEEAAQLYRLLWETTTDAVVIIDSRSVIRFANQRTMQIFGHRSEDLINESLAMLQPERLRQVHCEGMNRYLASGQKTVDWRAIETFGLHADGTEFPLELAFSEFVLAGSRLFVAFARDITARRKAEAELLAERELAEITLRSIGDAVISTDASGSIVFLNPMAERLTGWLGEDAVGLDIGSILRLVDQATFEEFTLPLEPWGVTENINPIPTGALLRSAAGTLVAIEGSTASITDRSGVSAGFVIAFRDVSLPRQLAQQVSYQASHDALTGLPNRSAFEAHLSAAIVDAFESKLPSSLLYLDLDQFKIVNDTCGHIAGDQLLKQLAGILAVNLRQTDILARLGGDEFGVLLVNCTPESAIRIAEKLRQAVAESTFVWNDRVFSPSVSVGHISFDAQGFTLADILSRADEACYVAKDEGRNRVRSYHSGDEALALRHGEMEWFGLIRQALAEDRFVLYAQPIAPVDECGGPCAHFEFLLRMHDRNGQLVLPMAFIPAAERFGLMPVLDRWVIRAVTAQVAARVRAGEFPDKPSFAINLSGASLADVELPFFIDGCLKDANVAPDLFCFEITETAAIGNLSSASNLIKEVKQLGCKFSLDDFGSGMSSFSYLKHLPVDYLKIDGSFVKDIANDEIDRAIVVSINHIGHLMGLRTIAEFVEDESVLRELRSIGVDFAQGYFVGRPAPWQSV